EHGVVAGLARAPRGQIGQIAGGCGGRYGAEIGDGSIPGRPPGAADVGPQPDDLPAALLQCHPRRPRLAWASPIVVVIVAGRYPMPAAAAVVEIGRAHV